LIRLIFDERLIPERTYPPMDYQSQKPITVDEVKMDDIKRFFVNYVFSDHLGKIANAHLAKADHLPGGAFHEDCKSLAQLHSDAVDFPKSGIPAKFPKSLRAANVLLNFQKLDKPSYRSDKVLGTLYRSIDDLMYKKNLRFTELRILMIDYTLMDMKITWRMHERLNVYTMHLLKG